MLFKDITAIYSANHITFINAISTQNARIYNVKNVGGVHTVVSAL
jgi:hypothetical protein